MTVATTDQAKQEGGAQGAPCPATPADIRRLLGEDAVLLPTPPGEKGPRIPGWNEITVEQAGTAEHRAQLGDDLALRLGPLGGNVADIDIDDDASVEPFLRLNPELAQTLQIRAARGRHFLLRVAGEYPEQVHPITDLDGNQIGEWRGDGVTKVCGTHPSGCGYGIVKDAPPVEMAFKDIVWPENWQLPWSEAAHEKLVRLTGPAFTDGKAITLNAQFFARLFAGSNEVIYEETEGRFYLWDPDTGIWVPRSATEMREAIFACYRKWADEQDPAIQEGLKVRCSRRFGDDCLEILKGVISKTDFFRPESDDTIRVWATAFKNGALTLFTEVLGPVPLEPELRLRHRIPHAYDPGASCPQFLAFLELVADADAIDLLQRVIGLMLLPVNHLQLITVISGPAGSGKSALMCILVALLGEERVAQLRSEQLESRFEIGAMAGQTHLFAPDVASDFLSEKGARRLKSLVGGDVLRGEVKYANDRVRIRGEFHVLITTNHALGIPAGDDPGAWRRRLVVVDFLRPVPEGQRVTYFARKLVRDEAPGILAWAVQGAVRASAEIVGSGRLVLTGRQQALVNRAVSETGRVEDFVRGGLARGDGDLSTEEINLAYQKWCRDRGAVPLPEVAVSRALARLMPEIHGSAPSHSVSRDGRHLNGYRGVTWG